MTPLDLALKFLEIFFSGKEQERLNAILHTDFQFLGPLYQFKSAQAYIDSLKTSPPVDCEYKLLFQYSDDHSAALFYEFSKPGVTTTMSQLFEVRDGKISRTVLIFDSAAFPVNE